MRWFAIWIFSTSLAWAEGERAGAFDYYVLALSWTPNWCAREGDARGSDQCDAGQGFGWTLHGLWPQFERGWPSYCSTPHREASRSETAAMADIMGSAGLAWHQWKKHGRCSGLPPSDYFRASRAAYDAVNRPQVLRDLARPVKLPARLIEETFLRDNPALEPDGLTVTCKAGDIQEVRICLSKPLEPRLCGRDVRRDCDLESATLNPMR